MDTMSLKPLHPSIVAEIIHLYECGNDPVDICGAVSYRFSNSIRLDEVEAILSDYNAFDPNEYTFSSYRNGPI